MLTQKKRYGPYFYWLCLPSIVGRLRQMILTGHETRSDLPGTQSNAIKEEEPCIETRRPYITYRIRGR